MKIYVDIDNTICKTIGNDYMNAEPIKDNISKINRLHQQGHEITYWTARGGTSGKEWKEFTEYQLQSWRCMYDFLKIGDKPFDLIIDDRSKRIDEI
jgi:hypothetical protein